jgi:hypothetical protein
MIKFNVQGRIVGHNFLLLIKIRGVDAVRSDNRVYNTVSSLKDLKYHKKMKNRKETIQEFIFTITPQQIIISDFMNYTHPV